MTRIKSDNIQFGESFILPVEKNVLDERMQKALQKEQEILQRVEQKAKEVLDAAQQKAAKIIEDAQTQAQAQTNDFIEQGRLIGMQQIAEEMQEKILTVENFAQSQFDIKNNIVKSAYLDIITLVIEIAKKVCLKSFEIDENILKQITQNAIQSLKEKEDITIIINPQMAEIIYSFSDELKELIPQLKSIKVIEDNSVSPDGTIVESPLSRVDCRITSQIEELAQKLFDKLNSTPNEEN